MKLNLEAASVSRSPARARVSQALACGLALALALPCVLAGCGKPPSGQPHEMAVQTERARSLEGLNRRGDAAYMAIVRAENETDLSFKLGGIVDIIGPETGSDWKEGTPVKEGAMLANLKPSEFVNALNSAKAQAELATKQLGRLRKLRESDTISPQEMDVTGGQLPDGASTTGPGQSEPQRLPTARLDQRNGAGPIRQCRDDRSRGTTRVALCGNRHDAGGAGGAGPAGRFFLAGQGSGVEITSLEGRPPFRGRVSEVGVAASQDGRLFRVVIKVPNPEGVIRSGMTATVRVGASLDSVPARCWCRSRPSSPAPHPAGTRRVMRPSWPCSSSRAERRRGGWSGPTTSSRTRSSSPTG